MAFPLSAAPSNLGSATAHPHPRPKLVLAEARPTARDRSVAPVRQRTGLGIAAILLSTLLFPMSDMLSKSLASTCSGIEVTWMRYIVLLAVMAPVALRRPALLRTSRPLLQAARGLSSAMATSLALVGFMFLPVENATAIGFCAPLIVPGLAALVLKEAVGWRRWLAAVVGFTGILVIVQPGAGTFQVATLLPLASSLFSAVTVITTRLGRTERVETTVIWSALVGFGVTSIAVASDWTRIDGHMACLGLLMGTLAAAASVLQVVAYRCAPASLIAPFSYAQILWATGIGWLAFGSVPAPAMLVGSAIVIASGCSAAWQGDGVRPPVPRRRDWGALRRELVRLHPGRQAA